MNTVLKISTVLSWINLVVGCYLLLSGIYGGLMVHDVKIMLIVVVFIGAIVLNNYAALQLRKCILQPTRQLSRETSLGVRFFGFVALFCSVMFVGTGVFVLQNLKEMAQQLPQQIDTKGLNVQSFLPGVGIFILVFGLTIALNVVLAMRLLRWYYLANQQR
jgi:hypothetical protein